MTERDLERVHWLPRIALVSFVIGLALVAVGFGHFEGAGPWFRTGAVSCLIAYFLVRFDNFKRKLPVQTRGGLRASRPNRNRCAQDGMSQALRLRPQQAPSMGIQA